MQRPRRAHGRQPTAHESRRQRTTHQRPSGQLDEDEWPVIGDWTTVHRKPDRRQPARHYEGATHAQCFFCRENGHNMENCRHGPKIVCHACHCLGLKAKFCTRQGHGNNVIAGCHRPIREGHTGVKCTNRFNILLNDTGDIDNDSNASDGAIRVRANNMSHVISYDACELLASSRSTLWRNDLKYYPVIRLSRISIDLDSLTKSIMKLGLKIGCLNIKRLVGKIDEISTILNKC